MKSIIPISAGSLFFALLLTIAGCSGQGDQQTAGQNGSFYDLVGYFESEMERLNREQPDLTKTVEFDGRQERKQYDSLDFERELRVFANANINRAALRDKYVVDSLFNTGTAGDTYLEKITYEAKEEKVKTKLIEIDFLPTGQIKRVYIESYSNSLAAELRQELTYQPRSGYSIYSYQDIALSEDKRLKVDVRFEEDRQG